MVIDASVAFKLIFNEPGSDRAIELAKNSSFIAPTLLFSEVTNALWKRISHGDISSDGGADRQLELLARVVQAVDEVPLMPRALQIAVQLGHPVYDCVYLAVAEAMDDDLLTADKRFWRAVRATPFAARVQELGV
ncbi:MAG: hypothetical protein QOD42_2591 [Sphingomonadales bacterium]|jgi:predicted nucleic acid-binding protein|nr:hypothetical protein [Sphingomonadales bacterium]